ncbi:hypothetical protein PJI23_32620, partial [Mycobacterium kansasii]
CGGVLGLCCLWFWGAVVGGGFVGAVWVVAAVAGGFGGVFVCGGVFYLVGVGLVARFVFTFGFFLLV